MAKLTPEQQKTLDELTALAESPDDDNDFEIEIRNGDRAARIPYHKGRSYLQEHFGIDLDPPEADQDQVSDPEADPAPGKGKNVKRAKTERERTSTRYFGGKQ